MIGGEPYTLGLFDTAGGLTRDGTNRIVVFKQLTLLFHFAAVVSYVSGK